MKPIHNGGSILIIDDDTQVAHALQRVLEGSYTVDTVGTAEEGIARAQAENFDVVVTDLQMPGMSGLELLQALHPPKPEVPIILMTGHHTTDTAIEAMKHGAYDYLIKPVNPEEFLGLVEKALAASKSKPMPVIQKEAEAVPDLLIGRSSAMRRVYKAIGRVAARPVTVLVRGETGTGKELVARTLYQHSNRADEPFVIVNCVAIPETLLENELFGHEAGAFTGAQTRWPGKFEQASKGTIFLDEVGDMGLAMQAKLLRVLEEKSIQRVGGKEMIPVDVRVIAATHCDLERAVEKREFREDLYYRLNDAVIRLPPLRSRKEDVPELVELFLEQQRQRAPERRGSITSEAMRYLQNRSWPGNVRQLKNLVYKAVLLAQGYPIDREIIRKALEQADLPEPNTRPNLQTYVAELLESAQRGQSANIETLITEWAERELYGQAIRLAEGDQTKVAKWLGVSRPTVRERLVHYDLHLSEEAKS
jgi:DNA-binding NtrC family response regulator